MTKRHARGQQQRAQRQCHHQRGADIRLDDDHRALAAEQRQARGGQAEDVVLILRDGTHKKGRVSKLTIFEGLKKEEVAEAAAGEIVAIAGFADVEIGETFADAITPDIVNFMARQNRDSASA